MDRPPITWPVETTTDLPPGHPDAEPRELSQPLPPGYVWGLLADGSAVPVRQQASEPRTAPQAAPEVARGLSSGERLALVVTGCLSALLVAGSLAFLVVAHAMAELTPALPHLAAMARAVAIGAGLVLAAIIMRRFSRGSTTVHNHTEVTNNVSARWFARPSASAHTVQKKGGF